MWYYIPFLFLIVATLVASTVVFVWAYRSGQFSDQDRARYLPLRGSDLGRPEESGRRDRKGPYALLALLTSAGVILLFTLVLALMSRKGG